jgi:hypothetical protein
MLLLDFCTTNCSGHSFRKQKLLTRKSRGGHSKPISPRNRKACHITSNALFKKVAEIDGNLPECQEEEHKDAA